MKRSGLTAVLVIIVIVLLAGVGIVYYKNNGSLTSHVIKDSGSGISDYSAVFLTNGQVYFGKLYENDSTRVDLRNIYYLQVNQQIQPDQKSGTTDTSTNSSNPNVVLVKLGQELHGPNDRMSINPSQVLFVESLKTDSKVVSAINNYSTQSK